jgi:hypothetical protein
MLERLLELARGDKNIIFTENVALGLGLGGFHETFKWVISEIPTPKNLMTTEVFRNIARSGNLEMLKWAMDVSSTWDTAVMRGASASGNFEMIKFLRELGCDWHASTFSNALLRKNFEILEWLKAENCPWTARTCKAAARTGKLKIVKWAVENGCPINPGAYLGALTALGDSTKSWKKNLKNSEYFEIIKYLASKECGLDRRVASAAAFDFKLLKWFLKKGCPWNRRQLVHDAAKLGNLEIMKWAKDCGGDLSQTCWDGAAESLCPNREIFLWLQDQGCPESYHVLIILAKNNHWNLLKFLLDEKILDGKLSPAWVERSGPRMKILLSEYERQALFPK